MSLLRAYVLTLSLALGPGVCAAELPARKSLSNAEQAVFLAQRTSVPIEGSFSGVASLLFASRNVVVHSDSQSINRAGLAFPFIPGFYQPTWSELFDNIARQTKSSWKYDDAHDTWVFAAPEQLPGFDLVLSDQWRPHDEGVYIGFQPYLAPVGMDVYMLGRFSADTKAEEDALFARVREAAAIKFASGMKPGVSIAEMSERPVGSLKGLFFQGTGPTGVNWRQWVVMQRGQLFAIVSAIAPPRETSILPDVQRMVASFQVTVDGTGGIPGVNDTRANGTPPVRDPAASRGGARTPAMFDMATSVLPEMHWNSSIPLDEAAQPVTRMLERDLASGTTETVAANVVESRPNPPVRGIRMLSVPPPSVVRYDETIFPASGVYTSLLPAVVGKSGGWVQFDFTGFLDSTPSGSAVINVGGVELTFQNRGTLGQRPNAGVLVRGAGARAWQGLNLNIGLQAATPQTAAMHGISLQFFPEAGTCDVYLNGNLSRDNVRYDATRPLGMVVTSQGAEAKLNHFRVGSARAAAVPPGTP